MSNASQANKRRLIDMICRPRSIAIATSLKKSSLGMNICKGLVRRIFEYVNGQVRSWFIPLYVVNKNGGEIEINGETHEVFKSIKDVFKSGVDTLEILIITINSKFVMDVLEQIPKGKVKAVIISSGGFGEKDEEGKEAEERVKQIANEKEFDILGINTLGVFTHAWNSSFTNPPTGNEITLPGKAVVFVQSGGMSEETYNFLSTFAAVKFVLGTGSTPEKTFVKLIKELKDDDETTCVGFYLEFMPGRDSYLSIKELARKKPVVVYFAKTNPLTTRIAKSHTGKLASSFDILRGALKQSKGTMLCTTQREFFNRIAALTILPKTPRTRCCIITITGGAGIAAASQLNPEKKELPIFPSELQESLKKFTVEVASVQNPIDMTGSVTDEQFKGVLKTLYKFIQEQRENNEKLLFNTILIIPFKTVPLLDETEHVQVMISFARRFSELGVSLIACDVGARYTSDEIKTLAQNSVFRIKFPDDIRFVLTQE
ncbi:MAG: CoA-binding protein [Promethearchaeota archaeon]